jgi:hypothetical protein
MRSSMLIRSELEICNKRRVQLDKDINTLREKLKTENAKASKLETEFQQAHAAEEQAKLKGA